MPDTDSDGIGDKDEIETGEDPLCPEGDICSLEGDLTPTTTEAIISPLVEQSDNDLLEVLGMTGDPQQGLDQSFSTIEGLLGSPEELRKILISTGSITEEELDIIDDETLINLTQNMMSSVNVSETDVIDDEEDQNN